MQSDEYTITPVWRSNDQNIERQAIQFWQSQQILPPGVSAEGRAKELCAVAHRNGELAGVATASIDELAPLRARFAMFRCSVALQHRRSHVGYDLLLFSRRLLEEWARAHPEENVKGMGIVLEAQIGDHAAEPVWPQTGLTIVGYAPNGRQIRVAWFAHARV